VYISAGGPALLPATVAPKPPRVLVLHDKAETRRTLQAALDAAGIACDFRSRAELPPEAAARMHGTDLTLVELSTAIDDDANLIGTLKASSGLPVIAIANDEEEEEETISRPRNVTVVVAKIADFQELSNTLKPAEFNAFLADYRKAASAIISNYGGVIEALLKDEIVAFFNAPEEQVNPELKAVCSAVEVLQLLASITRERKIEGKAAISGKIGIGMKSVPVYDDDSGMPHGVKQVTDMARKICTIAPVWRVIVSADVYQTVKDYVEARELKLGNDPYYSIVGVEEGVV